jgi:hypothetical protein
MSVIHIVDKHPEWLYAITDTECKILKSNEAFKDFTVHIRPTKFSDIVSDKKDLDHMLEAIEKAKEKPLEPIKFFFQTKQIDHTMHWGKWFVFFIAGKFYFCGNDRSDIGSMITYEAVSREKLLEYVNRFINHDIRQPLTSIMGVINVLVTDGTNEEMLLLTPKDNFEMIVMAKAMVEDMDEKLNTLIKKLGREMKS